ncbi:MAG: 30S ribosomal protein S1, partial [Oscillospiraceae bacterium]|nr:30S ribosomal protein S1 [Oscillospiraceae bacterium]
VKEYGIFIELTPNLSGLAEWRGDVSPGSAVSVYIKSIRPDTRKIKLQIIQDLGPAGAPGDVKYFVTDGPLKNWRY